MEKKIVGKNSHARKCFHIYLFLMNITHVLFDGQVKKLVRANNNANALER